MSLKKKRKKPTGLTGYLIIHPVKPVIQIKKNWTDIRWSIRSIRWIIRINPNPVKFRMD